MSWRPHSRARVNSLHPEAWGKCDRCSSLYNLRDLRYQVEWAGPALINRRLKVCDRCLDNPQEQLRTVRLGPDPVAVRDPRPINNAAVMGGYAVLSYQRQIISAPIIGDAGSDAGDDGLQRGIGLTGDAGLDAGSDTQTSPLPLQVAVPVVSDAGSDAGMDSAGDYNYYQLPPEEVVALEILLQVVPPGLDAVKGYPGSPFSTEEDELKSIPLSIDPPE